MTAYLIVYGATPSDRFAAYSFETRAAARLASTPSGNLTPRVPPDGPAGGCAYVIEREEDVTFNGKLLVDVFNALTESGVKKFESRAAGVKRLVACLPIAARRGDDLTNVPTKEKIVSENETETATKAPRGRKMAESKPADPAKFKPGRIRSGTDRHRILAMMTGASTVEEVGKAMGFAKPNYALAHFYCLARDCGIGYQLDADGHVTSVYPDGQSLETAIAAPTEPKAPKAKKAA